MRKKLLAAFSKLHIKNPESYFSSHFLMFDDPFCQFPTLSRDFLESLTKLFFRALRIVLREEKFFRTKKCFLLNFGVRAKKVLDFRQKIWQEWNFLKKKQFCKEETIFVLFRFWAKNSGKLPKKLLAAFPKLKITYPGVQISSQFLMFEDPFCQVLTFAKIFWKVFRNSFLWALRIVLTEEKFSRTKKCFFLMSFGVRAKKF